MDTSGYKGWWPVRFFDGKKSGQMTGSEGFRNVLNGQEVQPEQGWDGEPPYPTGELSNVRHVSPAYRRNYDLIEWER